MVTFRDVARALGEDCELTTEVTGVSSSHAPRPHTVAFVRHWSTDAATVVRQHPETLFLVPEGAPDHPHTVAVANPRLAYAVVVRDCLTAVVPAVVASTAVIDPGAVLGTGVSVGHFCVVEDGVEVADAVVLDHHVVLRTGVRVGPRTRIGSHTSIGGPGFGFEMDDAGTPVRIGHRGGVVIGADVEVGAHVSIAQGTIEPTVIGDDVKIDDCVFIAHNVRIGQASFVIAGAEISGSVSVGDRVWISPEATVINGVTIGDDALVGIGSVVVKDVASGDVVAGVPARPRGSRLRQPPGSGDGT